MSIRNSRRFPRAFPRALALAAAALLACNTGGETSGGGPSSGSPAALREGPLKVVATTGMIADLARRIAGDGAEVTALMGPGTDPHLYKAREKDIRLLSGADLVLINGLHLEGQMGEVLERFGRKRPVVAVGEAIDPARLRRPAEFAGAPDPHVWFDASLWAQAAGAVRDGLARVAPDRKAALEANAEALQKDMAGLHEWARTQIATIPEQRRLLVTAHDAFGYFGRAYGLEVRGIQGISTADEAGVRDLNALVDLLVERAVPAVFVESSVPRKNVEALVEGCRSRGHPLRIGGELFSDAMGAEGTPEGTWAGMFRHNVTTIVEALR